MGREEEIHLRKREEFQTRELISGGGHEAGAVTDSGLEHWLPPVRRQQLYSWFSTHHWLPRPPLMVTATMHLLSMHRFLC